MAGTVIDEILQRLTALERAVSAPKMGAQPLAIRVEAVEEAQAKVAQEAATPEPPIVDVPPVVEVVGSVPLTVTTPPSVEQAREVPAAPPFDSSELQDALAALAERVEELERVGRKGGETQPPRIEGARSPLSHRGEWVMMPFRLPPVDDTSVDYVLAWDGTAEALAWVETTTECPA